MTNEQIEKAAQQHADKYFIEDAEIICNEPWNNAKDLYAKTLADFAKHCISHQWVSVEERMPEEDKRVLVRIPASEFYSEYYAVAYWDGEDWIEAQRSELIRPSHWLPIPQFNPEKEER